MSKKLSDIAKDVLLYLHQDEFCPNCGSPLLVKIKGGWGCEFCKRFSYSDELIVINTPFIPNRQSLTGRILPSCGEPTLQMRWAARDRLVEYEVKKREGTYYQPAQGEEGK